MSSLPLASLTAIYPGQNPVRERLNFQFNPTTLRERIRVNYGVTQPINASHEIAHYRGTSSERIPLELFYTVIGRDVQGDFGDLKLRVIDEHDLARVDPNAQSAASELSLAALVTHRANPGGPGLKGVERFLKGLCYNDPDAGMHSPPFVIFHWPNILRLIGRIEELDIGYDQFGTEDLRGLVLSARMLFREDPPARIKQSIVRRSGSFRANSQAILALQTKAPPDAPPQQTVRSSQPLSGGSAGRGTR